MPRPEILERSLTRLLIADWAGDRLLVTEQNGLGRDRHLQLALIPDDGVTVEGDVECVALDPAEVHSLASFLTDWLAGRAS